MTTYYPATAKNQQELDTLFDYHRPSQDQQDRMAEMRPLLKTVGAAILGMSPRSREQSLAMTALGEVGLYFNAAIARREVVSE